MTSAAVYNLPDETHRALHVRVAKPEPKNQASFASAG